MRRQLVGDKFRRHYRVAELSTNLHRVGKFISAVAAHHAHEHEYHDKTTEKRQGSPLTGIAEIDPQVANGLSRSALRLSLPPVLPAAERASCTLGDQNG